MDFSVYVLQNLEGKRYIGSSSNVENRLATHNSSDPGLARFHRTTFARGPWRVVFRKNYQTRSEALRYEKFLKSGKGREFLRSVLPG